MSSVGVFTITELGQIGGARGGRPDGGEAEVFEWTSDRRPQDPVKGGGRAIPTIPWIQGLVMRINRTDYTGARTPTLQALGSGYEPQEFHGKWDDRYNFRGYAVQEQRRFEAFAKRMNMARISFQEQTFEGMIKNVRSVYMTDGKIAYSFEFEIYDRAGDSRISSRSPSTTKTPTEAYDDLNDAMNAVLALDEASRQGDGLESAMDTDTTDSVKASLSLMATGRDALGDTMDQRELSVEAGRDFTSPFRRIATQFRTVGSEALALNQKLQGVRSDLHLSATTVMGVLAFEEWTRTIRFQSRVLMGNATEAAADMDEREDPNALRIYRPSAGESLYAISRRFYGTAHAWRIIADRNGLDDFELTGDEILIIPERGQG